MYFNVTKFNFSKTLAYPLEISAFIFSRLFLLGILILFWSIVQKTSANSFDLKHILAYFFCISALNDLIFVNNFKFGGKIIKTIKNGEISNYLIKPVNTISFLLFTFLGENALTQIYSIIILLFGIIILPGTIFNILGFLILACLSFFIALSLNILIGSFAFYSPEASSFKNVFSHINNILSGAMIPLLFFPSTIKKFILLTPFASASFSPIYVLQNKVNLMEFMQIFMISLFWVLALSALAYYVWKKSLKKFEGVGL